MWACLRPILCLEALMCVQAGNIVGQQLDWMYTMPALIVSRECKLFWRWWNEWWLLLIFHLFAGLFAHKLQRVTSIMCIINHSAIFHAPREQDLGCQALTFTRWRGCADDELSCELRTNHFTVFQCLLASWRDFAINMCDRFATPNIPLGRTFAHMVDGNKVLYILICIREKCIMHSSERYANAKHTKGEPGGAK